MTDAVFDPPNLDDLKLLCAVVDCGSFSAAAEYLGTSQPRVSRAIARLEKRVGVPLVRRSSRGVAVTPDGERYATAGRRMLSDLRALEVEISAPGEEAGSLRVSAPPAVGRRLLLPHIASFCRQHPGVDLELSLGAARVDLIGDEVDVAIRFGPLQETWRRSRRLLEGRYHVYASPCLKRPKIRSAKALRDAPALVLHATHLRDRWPLRLRGEISHVPVTPRVLVDDVDALVGLAVAGLGVAMLPDFLVENEVERGELVRLTSESQAVVAPVYAVTASPPKHAVSFVKHLAANLNAREPRSATRR